MAKKYSEAAELAGIPESPVMRRDIEEAPPNPVLELHVGGVLVGDLPIEAQGRILYQQTDEGIAEANANKQQSCVRVVRDEFSKALDHRKDAVKDMGMDLLNAPNPLKEAMDKYVPKGFKGRFLAKSVVDRRGRRGWEPIKDETGQDIKVRDLTLGVMPEDVARARNHAVREAGRKLLGQVQEQYMAEGGKTALSD